MAHVKQQDDISVCYLCGTALSGQVDRDHVPMKQLYGKEYRRISNPDLFCLPTHAGCNHAYHSDEDYFVYSLVSVARHKKPGSYVSHDVEVRARRGKQRPLLAKVLDQFRQRIPHPHRNLMCVPLEGARINRVLWKITRGLYFRETSLALNQNVDKVIEFYTEDDILPEAIAKVLKKVPGKGDYPKVFDYRYLVVDHGHCFIISLWKCFIFVVLFHLPDCPCDICTRIRT